MTMHRRPVGRSRLLAAIGALVALAGCFLPWWSVGGDNGLPVLSGTGFEGLGILVFGAGIATLALVTLPYASERPVPADRWSSYAIIAGVGWLGFAYRIFDLARGGSIPLRVRSRTLRFNFPALVSIFFILRVSTRAPSPSRLESVG